MSTWTIRAVAFSVVAAVGVAIGCGSSDNKTAAPLAPSGKGESCTRTSDCKGGLVCVTAVCIETNAPVHLDDGGTSGGGGATSAQPLGGEGESCTRRADCEPGLACILQTCTSKPPVTATVDGGTTAPVSALGTRGESCQSVRDCADGLTCIPRSGGGGVCDLEEYGLEPTGKVCGAECLAATDCCELPPGVQFFDSTTFLTTYIRSCSDLVALLADPKICDGAIPTSLDGACFYYKAYCDCVANTWACTNSKCVYAAKCLYDGNVMGGCPTSTRTGSSTQRSTCDTTSGKCQPTACAADADCKGLAVSDDASDICQRDECVCVEKKCYRACNEDLDCPVRYTCDKATRVCTPGAGCAGDAECATRLGDVRAKCQTGACVVPCGSDHDCSGSGLSAGGGSFSGFVCSSKGICESLGCTSDDECQTAGGLRTFCTTPVDPGTSVRSATTD